MKTFLNILMNLDDETCKEIDEDTSEIREKLWKMTKEEREAFTDKEWEEYQELREDLQCLMVEIEEMENELNEIKHITDFDCFYWDTSAKRFDLSIVERQVAYMERIFEECMCIEHYEEKKKEEEEKANK